MEAGVDLEKLRKYERERLRYFYAVVDCDSTSTAAALYQQCDGLVSARRPPDCPTGLTPAPQEFERSSTRFDLRYIPDEQSFEGRTIREAASQVRASAWLPCPPPLSRLLPQVPPSYVPVDYTSRALQQTSVGLSWDADDPDRKKQLRRKITAEQLKDEDFAAYLGSGSEEEEGDGEETARLRTLIMGGSAAGPEPARDADGQGVWPRRSATQSGAQAEGDMIVTFGGGLEERLQARRAGVGRGEPAAPATVWEEHLAKRQAKKVAARLAAAPPPDTTGFDDPYFAGGGAGAGAWAEPEEEEEAAERPRKKLARGAAVAAPLDASAALLDRQQRAKLELLVMDDAQLRVGELPDTRAQLPVPGAGRVSRKEARRVARAAKLAAREEDEGLGGEGGGLDAGDARFEALFVRPEFALDPTDPRFKAVKRGVDVIRKEKAARAVTAAGGGGGAADLSGAVRRLKGGPRS